MPKTATKTTPQNFFAKYEEKNWPHRFALTIQTTTAIVGGVPTDERVAEAWIRTKVDAPDDITRRMLAQTMAEREVGLDEAIAEVANKKLNGFKRDADGLYVEGRQLKSCIKEACNVAAAEDRLKRKGWAGVPGKGILSFVAEHVFVVDNKIHLGVHEPTGVMQSFISGFRGSSIQYEEYVEDAVLTATIETDHNFSADEWAAIWTTAARQGLGAKRSQGYGRFVVTDWKKL